MIQITDMKGIFITAEGKQELEAEMDRCANKIKELQSKGQKSRPTALLGRLGLLEQISASATVLPVEENYDAILVSAKPLLHYSKGVIIQPKQ